MQFSASFDNLFNIITSKKATVTNIINDNIDPKAYGNFLLFFVTISLFKFIKNNVSHAKNNNQKNTIENICNNETAVHHSTQNAFNLFGSLIRE